MTLMYSEDWDFNVLSTHWTRDEDRAWVMFRLRVRDTGRVRDRGRGRGRVKGKGKGRGD